MGAQMFQSHLKLCKNCGRKFAAERLNIHMKTCGHEKKRKVFDMTKMRVKGTEAEGFNVRKKKPEIQVSGLI